ncbi:lamin tail domain-containing protein [Nocardiopsis tropica]|uniref:Lamin tail domain-containing protein n=1 Tax=Nocardiopsis tropica TaxID=109330 RepID=A0ABU7KNV6_9ACTN|nr:lamin tail domain-containing protein [Nocardiopsis umidischolae]MEE2050963.1 lamin tail domain-containing protein [Nocardiopsis umidischolae]
MPRPASRVTAIAAAAVAALSLLSAPAQAASSSGALTVTHVRANSAGTDTKSNLNGEYFVIKNTSTKTVNLRGYVPDITSNTYGRVLPSYNLPAGAVAYVRTGSGTNRRDASGNHQVYRGYARHVLPNDATGRSPDLRLKRPGSADNNSSSGSISSCNWGRAANGTTYRC